MKKIMLAVLLGLFCLAPLRAAGASYTNYLVATSNALASAYAAPSNSVRVQKALNLALGNLRKTSTSVAGDLSLLSAIQTQTSPLGSGTPALLAVSQSLSNALTNFVLEAQAEMTALWQRLDLVTPFQMLRRSASNEIVQAANALAKAGTATKFPQAISAVRLAYVKIGNAARLTARAEASPGLAPSSLMGIILHHTENRESGVVAFTTADTYAEVGPQGFTDAGSYEYVRTGLSTARFLLHNLNDPDGGSTSVNVRFTTAQRGTFTFRYESANDSGQGSGVFSTEPIAHPGVAPVALTGLTLHHLSRYENFNGQGTNSGAVVFTSATEFTATDSDGTWTGNYEYSRTGPNTASLVLRQGMDSSISVNILYSASAAGYFSARTIESGVATELEGGTFTIEQ